MFVCFLEFSLSAVPQGYTPANYARSLPTLEALLRNQRENAARAALVSPAPVSNATSLLPMSQSQSQSQPQSQSQCQSQALSAQTAAPSLSPTPVSGGAASAAVGGSSLSASVPTSSAPVSLAIGGDGGAVDQTEIGSQ